MAANNHNNNNNNLSPQVSRPSSSQSSTSIAGPSSAAGRRRSLPSSSCITKLEPLRLSQRWHVVNFATVMKLAKPGVCLRSQVFKDASFPDACWQLCLYPGGKRDENINNVSLFLKMSATTPAKEVLLKAEYRFYFLDDNDEAKFSNINIGDFHAKPPKGGHSWGLRNIPRPKVSNAIRQDESLMILCEIELVPDPNKVRCTANRITALPDMVEVPRAYVKAFESLWDDRDTSDCTVDVPKDHKSFFVHKSVLSAHSVVFRAMLHGSDFMEKSESKVTIEDFSADAVKAFLRHMYTGSLDVKTSDDLIELIGLSEKYALNDLKSVCQDQMIGELAVSNVCELLVHADLYRAEHLYEACIEFISNRHRAILATDEWAQLKEHNQKLANDVLERMLPATTSAHESRQPPSKRPRRPE